MDIVLMIVLGLVLVTAVTTFAYRAWRRPHHPPPTRHRPKRRRRRA